MGILLPDHRVCSRAGPVQAASLTSLDGPRASAPGLAAAVPWMPRGCNKQCLSLRRRKHHLFCNLTKRREGRRGERQREDTTLAWPVRINPPRPRRSSKGRQSLLSVTAQMHFYFWLFFSLPPVSYQPSVSQCPRGGGTVQWTGSGLGLGKPRAPHSGGPRGARARLPSGL